MIFASIVSTVSPTWPHFSLASTLSLLAAASVGSGQFRGWFPPPLSGVFLRKQRSPVRGVIGMMSSALCIRG
ncbi:hypothetical protein F2Q68_00006105 [Brassica cretica]|uniref:Uncharacterized protein n=1 Tax=Brassica cretica TaxID=69181 RepID=A0A8S9J6L0_BRACR|nr:hypothetical protein F2Q68_00006105 [Brassica cretica]